MKPARPQEYLDKYKATRDLNVLAVKRHQNGRFVDLWIEKPTDMNFKSLNGVGIPGSLTDEAFKQLVSKLKHSNETKDYTDYLRPADGCPGPVYAAPSDAFLKLLFDKAVEQVGKVDCNKGTFSELEKNTACLWRAMNNNDELEKLKANYTLQDLVNLFPKVLSAKDIIETQPPEHGNKTYTVDARQSVVVDGKQCFRISIAQDDGHAYQALFGEKQPKTTAKGLASTYLRSLSKGQTLKINAAIKTKANLPAQPKADRPLMLIAQGNSMINMLPLLEDLRQKRLAGETVGPVIIVGAFQTRSDILELEELKSYINDNTLTEMHLCLSREKIKPAEKDSDGIHYHDGKRVQDLVSKSSQFYVEKPFVYVVGGKAFCEGATSVSMMVAKFYGYLHPEDKSDTKSVSNIRISKAPNRRHKVLGKSYTTVDPMIAVKRFCQYLNSKSKVCKNPNDFQA